MHGDELADAARGRRTSISGSFDGAYVATHHDRDVAGTNVFFTDEQDVRRFHHGVGGFDRSDLALCFNNPELPATRGVSLLRRTVT